MSATPPETQVAAQAVLARHQRWLRTVVFARTGSAEAVDEVLQEVAVAVCDNGTEPDEAGPWLYRVAVRQSLLYRRRNGRRDRLQRRYFDRQAETGGEADADPLDWLLAAERRQLIRTAIERLTSKDAEILLLKYTEDWTYKQLARRLGVTESAVEARLHRARSRLRHELTRLQVIEVD